jgi:hypothetical protein
MPRYLDVPLLGSEEEDMQQHAVAYCNHLAQKGLALAEQISKALDQYPEHWQPDNLLDLEQLVSTLEDAIRDMKRNNLMPNPPTP